MKILALEFSSAKRSVAVLENEPGAPAAGGFAGEASVESSEPLTLVESALREARLEREQIECIAVGLGPGSYAGIRSAISLAQGWQLARNVKLLGLSSVECIATQALAREISGRIFIIVDAQRNEFYLAGYELKAPVVQMIEPLQLATFAEASAKAAAGETLIGPEVTRWFPKGQIIFPDAATLAKLASLRRDFVPGETLAPIYLRETSFVKAPPPRTIV